MQGVEEMKNVMPRLGAVLDKESYSWMAANHPEVLDAIEAEVAAGRSPQDVRLFVLRQTGRIEIALRCEQSARYVAAQAGPNGPNQPVSALDKYGIS